MRTRTTVVLLIVMTLVLQGCPSLIPNRPPNAEFTANPTSGEAPLTVHFDASASSDPDKDNPDGDIVSYEWEFGDGGTATGKTVDHTYDNEGTFTAKLTVTDGQGASDSDSKTIDVSAADNQPPNASFTANPTSGTAPLDVAFDASGSSDPDGTIQSYEWDFGDGDNGTGATPSHTYDSSGTFTVTLTVTDDDGTTDAASTQITVSQPLNQMDAVFAIINGPNQACLGSSSGSFNCSDISTNQQNAADAVLADVDEDGNTDVVFGHARWSAPNRVCLGDGTGKFSCSKVANLSNKSRHLDLGDVNGDGYIDAVFANANVGGHNQICLGDGMGNFACSKISNYDDISHGIQIGKVNNDQHQDLVIANRFDINRYCLGDGASSFKCSTIPNTNNDTFDVEVGDFNNDGSLDALFSNSNFNSRSGSSNQVCIGNGNGNFNCSVVSSIDHDSLNASVTDFNNDGNLDVAFANNAVFTNPDSSIDQRNRICLGDGHGSFNCSPISSDNNDSRGIAVGDINGDQVSDIVIANSGPPGRSCIGDGQGGFTCSALSQKTTPAHEVTIGNIDD